MSDKSNINPELFHQFGIDVANRVIVIDGDSETENYEITLLSARNDIKNLHILDSINHDPITIILNCHGGDVLAGMAIYDAIRSCKSRVIMKVHCGMSMGSILLQGADERWVYPHATIMIHSGEVGMQGTPKTVENWNNYNKKMDKIHEDIYLKRIKEKKPRFKREELQKMLEQDTIFTAKEAIELGLADYIIKDGGE